LVFPSSQQGRALFSIIAEKLKYREMAVEEFIELLR
jgi:hypothetical protein